MKELKYIIVKDEFDNDAPVMFTSSIIHSYIRARYCPLISAGFTKIYPNTQKVICYGESTSLGLESRGEIDAKIIHELIFG